ncbi:hypothetical protein OSTOST_03350, partial [Ostertagia ostertagi]
LIKSFLCNFTNAITSGYPAGTNGAPNLVTPLVDSNWKDPHGVDGYAYYIDQPTTLLPYTYHVKAWSTYQNELLHGIIDTMNAFAATQGVTLDQRQLQNDAAQIVSFDHLLAMTYSTDDTTRRQFDRSYNPMTARQLMSTYPQISWHTFLGEAVGPALHIMQRTFSDPDIQVYCNGTGETTGAQ